MRVGVDMRLACLLVELLVVSLLMLIHLIDMFRLLHRQLTLSHRRQHPLDAVVAARRNMININSVQLNFNYSQVFTTNIITPI